MTPPPDTCAGLWGTALTENVSNNREKYIRTTLRELLVYLLFLLDICLCEFDPQSSVLFHQRCPDDVTSKAEPSLLFAEF